MNKTFKSIVVSDRRVLETRGHMDTKCRIMQDVFIFDEREPSRSGVFIRLQPGFSGACNGDSARGASGSGQCALGA